MKLAIQITITAVALSIVAIIPGQNNKNGNAGLSAKKDSIDVFMPGAFLHDNSSDDYYYNTYEITKLEWELNQLASFYRGDLLRKTGFSSYNYENLPDVERKAIKDKLNSFSVTWKYDFKSTDKDSKKLVEQYAEEYFNRFIAPYITREKDKPFDKEKLQNEIIRRLNQLFELKEIERQNRITRLEKELIVLKESAVSRDKNKTEIVEQRLKKLIGLPANLKW